MTESPFESGPYASLKVQFIKTMEESITKNKNATLNQFPDKVSLNSHVDKVSGWQEAVDAFKKLAEFIENPPSPGPAPEQSIMSPTITDGEIVE